MIERCSLPPLKLLRLDAHLVRLLVLALLGERADRLAQPEELDRVLVGARGLLTETGVEGFKLGELPLLDLLFQLERLVLKLGHVCVPS